METKTADNKQGSDTGQANPEQSSSYHFTHPNLSKSQDGSYVVHYPNITLTFSSLPAWARTDEKLNILLDKSPDPVLLRETYDQLISAAANDDIKNDQNFTTLKCRAQQITDPLAIKILTEMFELRLQDEYKSCTNGSAMAETYCNELNKYREILSCLKTRT